MPEAITGTPWIVIPQPQNAVVNGATDVKGNKMSLPDAGAPNERFVRLHELGHAKFTPSEANPTKLASRYKCKEVDIQVVEDMRIHSLLAFCAKGHNTLSPLLDKDVQPHSQAHYANQGANMADYSMSPKDHLEVITLMAMQHHVTYGDMPIQQHGLLTHRYREALSCYEAKMMMDPNAPKGMNGHLDTIIRMSNNIIGQVAKQLAGKRHGSKKLRDFKNTCKAAQLLRKLLSELGETLPEEWGEEYDSDMASKSMVCSSATDGQWGELVSIDTLNLSVPHRPKEQPIKTRQAVPMGARLGHIRRLITDGRAFSRTRKLPLNGGTVLIDASGSMEMPTADIMRYLDNAPSSTIAMYSANPRKGKITIIAKNGRLATERDIQNQREIVGGGNIIDGPALDWLAKQAEPRIWICDGYVTGINDKEHNNLSREAMIKAKRGKIKRYNSIEDATNATSR